MKASCITFVFAFILSGQSYGQEEAYRPDPCGEGNKSLKEILTGQILKTDIYLFCGGGGGHSQLCSSMLKNSSKPPAKPSYRGLTAEEQDSKKQTFETQYDSWSCQYSPKNLNDDNPATAWVEGASGDGIGELVIVQVDVNKKIKIWNGFGKSDALFRQNNRPKKVKMHIVKVKLDPTQCGTFCKELSLVASSSPITLRDINGFQDLPPVPGLKNKLNEPGYDYWLGIEIVEVYPGSKYHDTCISEISN